MGVAAVLGIAGLGLAVGVACSVIAATGHGNFARPIAVGGELIAWGVVMGILLHLGLQIESVMATLGGSFNLPG